MQIEQLFDFLHRSVSPFHAVHTAAQLLDAAGYTRLEEAEYWNLEPEHGYYVTRNESSIIAWRVPAHAIGGWRIAASHSDSPTWRIKNTNVNAAGCIKLNVEGYGGMIMSTVRFPPPGVCWCGMKPPVRWKAAWSILTVICWSSHRWPSTWTAR